MSARGRIVVAGRAFDVAGQAGATWAVLQYVIGLRELGYDAWLLEPVTTLKASTARTFAALTAEFDLQSRAALLVGERGEVVGCTRDAIDEACGSADALIDLSGVLAGRAELERFALRAYVDLDPAFNQFWHASGIDRGFGSYTHHFSVGVSLGSDACAVPTCGFRWAPLLPPVALSAWQRAAPRSHGPLTTVANWRSYGSVEAGGIFYGQKAHSLRRLVDLPLRAAAQFVLALDIHPAEHPDLQALRAGGWEFADPREVAGTPSSYREFIEHSRAELGVAKEGYVRARCGWFSDRSACYLACGRPVLAQDTGFDDSLPAGDGLLRFSDTDGALTALELLESDYARHAAGARAIAEEYLDARVVLGRLLTELSA